MLIGEINGPSQCLVRVDRYTRVHEKKGRGVDCRSIDTDGTPFFIFYFIFFNENFNAKGTGNPVHLPNPNPYPTCALTNPNFRCRVFPILVYER